MTVAAFPWSLYGGRISSCRGGGNSGRRRYRAQSSNRQQVRRLRGRLAQDLVALLTICKREIWEALFQLGWHRRVMQGHPKVLGAKLGGGDMSVIVSDI